MFGLKFRGALLKLLCLMGLREVAICQRADDDEDDQGDKRLIHHRDEAATAAYRVVVERGAHGGGSDARRLAHFAAVYSVFSKNLFNPEELVVFRHAVCATEGTGLNLSGVRCHCDIGDGGVLRLAGAM
jgi:hypothetical protein